MATCVGCGLTSSPAGLLEVQLRPGGGISCDNSGDADDGLFLTPAGPATVSTTGGDCTIISGNGAPGTPLRIDAEVSGDVCNGISCRGNGLYAPCPDSYACIMNQGICGAFVPFAINTGGAGNFNLEACCADNPCSNCVGSRWQVCNPSPCCTMEGFISVLVYGGAITGPSVGFDAEAHVEVQYGGGGWTISTPPTYFRMQNLSGNRSHFDIANMEERNYLLLAPSECIDFQARITINVFAGSATWAAGPGFEYYVHTTQTNCGCSG